MLYFTGSQLLHAWAQAISTIKPLIAGTIQNKPCITEGDSPHRSRHISLYGNTLALTASPAPPPAASGNPAARWGWTELGWTMLPDAGPPRSQTSAGSPATEARNVRVMGQNSFTVLCRHVGPLMGNCEVFLSLTWEHWEPLQLDKAGDKALKQESSPISLAIFKLESEKTFYRDRYYSSSHICYFHIKKIKVLALFTGIKMILLFFAGPHCTARISFKDKQTCVFSFHICGRHQAVVAWWTGAFLDGTNLGRFLVSDHAALFHIFWLHLSCMLSLWKALSSVLLQLLFNTTRGRHQTKDLWIPDRGCSPFCEKSVLGDQDTVLVTERKKYQV